jgi:hypothetical protein
LVYRGICILCIYCLTDKSGLLLPHLIIIHYPYLGLAKIGHLKLILRLFCKGIDPEGLMISCLLYSYLHKQADKNSRGCPLLSENVKIKLTNFALYFSFYFPIEMRERTMNYLKIFQRKENGKK